MSSNLVCIKINEKNIIGRIVSISQPHIRPIVRGKAEKNTEFGAKIRVSMKDGLAFAHNIGWDTFNEGKDLQQQGESYKQRPGYYPEVVLADQLYGSLENRKHLKDRGISFGGSPLGHSLKMITENASHQNRCFSRFECSRRSTLS